MGAGDMIGWGRKDAGDPGHQLGRLLAGALILLAPGVAAAQTATLAPPGVGGGASAEYRITAGDELDVSVWGDERMQRTVRVLSDGTFAFPLAGTVEAVGRTVAEVSTAIRGRIAGNYRTQVPDVTVGLRSAAGMSFYVVGKVRTPGTYASARAVNVVQALSMAGGLAEFADVKHAVILRQTPTGQVVEPVKLAAVLKGRRRLGAGALAEALPILRAGDVLVIP
jgi:polysaccharide export outer membrane protein